jgi:phosphatidylglycerophosphate synthase
VRKDRGAFQNLVKWLAIRTAYVFYRLGFSSNVVTVIFLFLAFFGLYLASRAMYGEKLVPVIGLSLVCFHVFGDFADGCIAKAKGECSKIGALLDDVGLDADRFALLVLLAVFSGYTPMLIINSFAAGIFVMFVPVVVDEFPHNDLRGRIARFYPHRFFALSVRFMLGVLPGFLSAVILLEWNLQAISMGLSIFYASLAVGWLLLCLPHYKKEARDHQQSRGTV